MSETSLSEPSIPAARSRYFWRRVALAPVCLLLVAAVHFYRVSAVDQTQWKGGGFGMFSTVDGPNARFVRAELIFEDHSAPIAIPAHVAKVESELRSAPSQRLATELAARLSELTWVDATKREQRRAPVARLSCSAPRFEPALDTQRASALPIAGVHVELWRFAFDRDTNQLQARPVLAAEARVP